MGIEPTLAALGTAVAASIDTLRAIRVLSGPPAEAGDFSPSPNPRNKLSASRPNPLQAPTEQRL
jgi:hypothetical protein